MNYYAHSAKRDVPAQAYKDHIMSVRERAVQHAHEAGAYSLRDGALLARLAGMGAEYHDLGKLHKENQMVLSGEIQAKKLPKNHVDAGTAHFLKDKNHATFAAALINAHHCGYPNFVEEANRGLLAFRDEELLTEINDLLPEFEHIHQELVTTHDYRDPGDPQGDRAIFLRMLLSCLADADHTDTALHYRSYSSEETIVSLQPLKRLALLNNHVGQLMKEDERSRLRHEMYLDCREAAVESNISSCDSPVGSGKTTAVMAHLLTQAAKRGLRRIFVVLPYTNIITQSVARYREALVMPGENPEHVVAELHHRADFESLEARHLTALWRAPIIVTTAVTFFETLASNTPSTLRRLHELPGSAIFVDESHAALPAKLLPLAWKWMNFYANEWGCYWVLASGSLNRFWQIKEIAQETTDVHVSEIVSEYLREKLLAYEKKRIAYRHRLQSQSSSELIEWVDRFPGPRLIIVNTVQSAAVVADAYAKHFGRQCVEHVSTALTSSDREKTFDRVKKRLSDPNDKNWTLVATSCVEAGVDLSFRTGFRELGSLVSLLQTAGRVERNGDHPDAEIWTFRLAFNNMLKDNPSLKDASQIMLEFIKRGREVSPALSTESIAGEIRLSGVNSKFKELLQHEKLSNFRTVEARFQVIDSNTKVVVIDKEFASKVLNNNFNWQDLQKTSVRIAEYKLKELGGSELLPGIYEWKLDYNNFLGYMAGIISLSS